MGLFSNKEENESELEELTPALKAKLDEFAEKGNQFEKKGQYEEAMQAWKEGLNLIPEPQQFYSETIWFLASIGDVYYKKGMYPQAYQCFNKARGNLYPLTQLIAICTV